MAAILESIGLIFTSAIGWVGDVAAVITSATEGVLDNPILLLFAVIPLVGLGIGMFKRLINVN